MLMKYLALFVVICMAIAQVHAAEPDDVQFHRAATKIAAAAQKLEFARMFDLLVRKGADMGPGDGWFKPAEGRYNWKWLSARCGGKERISPKDFDGPPDLFARLDRDRDGFLTAADFDWTERSPYMRQLNQAQQWLRQRSPEGKITREQWDELFKQLARDKEYLNADDVRALLNPPPPPPGQRRPGPGEGPPSKAVLLQGLFTGEIGSIFEGPKIGQKAPDFTLPTHDGKKIITLSEYVKRQKPVVLVFGSFT
jgi:hypothetical protein